MGAERAATTSALADWTRAWRDAAAAQQAWWRSRFDEGVKAYRSGAAGAGTAEPAAAARALATESVRFWRDLATATVRHGTAYADAVAALTREFTDRAARAGATGAAVRRLDAALRGPAGGEAVTTITVANPRAEPADVSFDVGVLRTPGGGALTPVVTFTPPSLRLAPGAEQPVTMRVALDSPGFVPGATYSGIVTVAGSDALEIALTLTVD